MTEHTTGYIISDTSLKNYKLYAPKLSEWQCYCFGMGEQGICFRPLEGKEPNWFWRKMQYLCFGNKWAKVK